MSKSTNWTAVVCGALLQILISCKTRDAPDAPEPGLVQPMPQSLQANDFPNPLTRTYIRSTNDLLTDTAFNTKWDQSHVNNLLFFRAFPSAYHGDFSQVPRNRLPGGESLCLGDAHPDNFGFLHLDGQTVFAFNDLDDSGNCPIVLDIMRYLTAAQLNWKDDALTAALLKQYIDTLKDPAAATSVPASLLPDWTKIETKEMQKLVADNAFVLGTGSSSITDAEAQTVKNAMQTNDYLKTLKVIQVIAYVKDSGGSGGLKRYRLLVENPSSKQTILEFKSASAPGTDFGKPANKLSFDERLPLLKKGFWFTSTNQDYFYIMIDGTRYLVRDRLSLDSVNLTKLTPEDLRAVLLAQVSYMARAHAPAWQNVNKDELQRWLTESLPVIAARWGALYDAG